MPTNDNSDKVVEWIEDNDYVDFDADDYEWKAGEEKEIREKLKEWYNRLPEDKKGSRLKGFIESSTGNAGFARSSKTLEPAIKKSNEEYIDEISALINGKNKPKTVLDVDIDNEYLDDTVKQLQRLKENRRIELAKREAKDIESASQKSFVVLQERFRVARDRQDANELRDLGNEIRDDENLSEVSKNSLLERTIIALDNIEGR